ncbi:hypothetical protein SGFS_095970 [Streptomyces graminofaciens]|uniref:Uncharacterized protein n=1 Tax=Streptomyces graminofaciens TaxID=68212 RepID=A0ABM7FJJ0_9ACTN|nr:hypothetical protein SGFS_095970 [Streptomyces graminofaciens]
MICESGEGREIGFHQSVEAAELDAGVSIMPSAVRNSVRTISGLRLRDARRVLVITHVLGRGMAWCMGQTLGGRDQPRRLNPLTVVMAGTSNVTRIAFRGTRVNSPGQMT